MATWTEDPRTSVTLAWERHEEGSARVVYREMFQTETEPKIQAAEQSEPARGTSRPFADEPTAREFAED